MTVLAFPGLPSRDRRDVHFHLAVEGRQLGVMPGDLGVVAGDAVVDLTPSGGMHAPTDGPQPMQLPLYLDLTPAGFVSLALLVLALVGESADVR